MLSTFVGREETNITDENTGSRVRLLALIFWIYYVLTLDKVFLSEPHFPHLKMERIAAFASSVTVKMGWTVGEGLGPGPSAQHTYNLLVLLAILSCLSAQLR